MKQHSPRFLSLVKEAKKHITEISAAALKEKIDRAEPLVVIDVREDQEGSSSGHIPSALNLGKGIIERDIEKAIIDPDVQIVVYGSGGCYGRDNVETVHSVGC